MEDKKRNSFSDSIYVIPFHMGEGGVDKKGHMKTGPENDACVPFCLRSFG